MEMKSASIADIKAKMLLLAAANGLALGHACGSLLPHEIQTKSVGKNNVSSNDKQVKSEGKTCYSWALNLTCFTDCDC